MLQVRLEKLKFIVEEMALALFLSKNIDDSFVARTLALHIIVRIKDFIAHADQLRKPLAAGGCNVTEFVGKKKAYTESYDEYYKLARDKNAAHVQDVDFADRIELWNDIEMVKMEYFVDGATEIYESLAKLKIPGYVPYKQPSEIKSPNVIQELRLFQRALENDSMGKVVVATDVLALTRDHTSGLVNTTDVHLRAGQIVLLHRWIRVWRDLLTRLQVSQALARIIKERLLTDIVSTCDCLVTRQVAPGSPQEMDGLDKLIIAHNGSPAAIANFVSVSRFADELLKARSLRNTLGAHLDINPQRSMNHLLNDLDAYDIYDGLAFYDRVYAAFRKTCFENLMLRPHAADGRKLHGLMAAERMSIPFGRAQAPQRTVLLAPPQVNDEQEYQRELGRWLDGDEEQRGEARTYFFHAFTESQVVSTITDTTTLPSGTRSQNINYRRVHQYLENVLPGFLDDDFAGAMKLLASGRGGDPHAVAELAVRLGNTKSVMRLWYLCRALGEIGSGPHQSVVDFLRRCGSVNIPMLRLEAATARFRTYVKVEAQHRFNSRGGKMEDYDAVVLPLLAPMSDAERFVCRLAFASILAEPNSSNARKQFETEFQLLKKNIEDYGIPLISDDLDGAKAAAFQQLVKYDDFVGASVHLVTNLAKGAFDALHELLMNVCYNGTILYRGDDGALQNLVMCFAVKEDFKGALQLAEGIITRNPDWVDIQILAAEIQANISGEEPRAIKRIAAIRSGFQLTAEQEARLQRLATAIAKPAVPVGPQPEMH